MSKQNHGKGRVGRAPQVAVTQVEMEALSQAPVYYAALLLTVLPPTPEREEVLNMLEVVEARLAALTLRRNEQPEQILFTFSCDELLVLYHAILGYLAVNAPGTNMEALLAFTERIKPFLPLN